MDQVGHRPLAPPPSRGAATAWSLFNVHFHKFPSPHISHLLKWRLASSSFKTLLVSTPALLECKNFPVHCNYICDPVHVTKEKRNVSTVCSIIEEIHNLKNVQAILRVKECASMQWDRIHTFRKLFLNITLPKAQCCATFFSFLCQTLTLLVLRAKHLKLLCSTSRNRVNIWQTS